MSDYRRVRLVLHVDVEIAETTDIGTPRDMEVAERAVLGRLVARMERDHAVLFWERTGYGSTLITNVEGHVSQS